MGDSLTQPYVPVLTKEKFAEQIGVSADVVRGWIARHQIPHLHIGRRVFVNVAALNEQAKNA
jgi:excisionase family DNA binding protein